jgi:surfeit locus 1 family protein
VLQGVAVALAELPADTAAAHYRRVRVVGGVWDFEHQIALIGRTRQGSPGVNIVTPLVFGEGGARRAVLVNRGWVYSPDAESVDLARWREPAAGAPLTGYVETFPAPRADDPRSPAAPRAWRRLDAARLERELGYPLAPYYVIASGDEGTSPRSAKGAPDVPARLPPPALDEGPHKSYAIQWFSFAAIALVGVSALIWQDMRKGRDQGPGTRGQGTAPAT